jgi:butyryl-CoA dehydrogenase/short/branched chain acyl-CoA dehydrogenase
MSNIHLPLTVLSDEETMFRDMVRSFAEEHIQPLTKKMDEEAHFDKNLVKKFFEQGFMGIEIPEEYGGAGSTFFNSILLVEEFSRVDASAGVMVDVQNTLVDNAFMRWGSKEIKDKYLPKLAGESVGSYALSEASSGSDAFALETRAEDKGDHFVLNGQKLWITNGNESDIFIIFANVNKKELGYKGITAFVVERGFKGFSVGKKEDKLGIRASSTTELILEDCIVPKENVLGEIGKGYKTAIETLNEGRIGIASQMLGLAQGSLEHGIKYSTQRMQFGKSLAKFQAIQFQLAELATEIEAARLMVYNAARLKDAKMDFVKEAAMAKYFASQVAEKVSSQVIEVFGGYGFTKDYPAEKYFRDSKIGKIYEGTSFMQLQTIAKLIIKE